jgi:hypothetical protein
MNDENRQTYQNLYDNSAYGKNETNSPGVKFLEKYRHHIKYPLVDVGCGVGLLVHKLREENNRRKVDGIDFVVNADETLKVADITQPLDLKDHYRTAVCMDVMEHIEPGLEVKVIDNLSKVDFQVISVHSGPSKVRPGGKELHINQRSWDEWKVLLSEKLNIIEEIPVSEFQIIFLCSRKKREYKRKSDA